MNAKFSPGRFLVTPGAISKLQEAGISPASLLVRHLRGDWGVVDSDDRRANERALSDGSRLLSAYIVNGTRFWVITEGEDDRGERAATTVLLPSEY